MTRIDFYVLEGARGQARARYACRLVDKAYAMGHRIYVHTGGPGQTRYLDELLWTFREDGFIPHEAATAGDDQAHCAVLIGHDQEPGDDRLVLVNLAEEVPLFFSRFERMAEIVDEEGRGAARERFAWYKERGYPLQHHRIELAPARGPAS